MQPVVNPQENRVQLVMAVERAQKLGNLHRIGRLLLGDLPTNRLQQIGRAGNLHAEAFMDVAGFLLQLRGDAAGFFAIRLECHPQGGDKRNEDDDAGQYREITGYGTFLAPDRIDLITISQLEIGEITMHMSNFDLRRLCESVFEQLEEAARNRNVKLRIYRYSPKSCYIHADKNRIGQVLTNLVMNGIKYGREGGDLTINLHPENNHVTVTVRDNGPGIASVHLKRIFERFYRIDKSRSKNLGGTGLGLSIVKHILEAHDSKIKVESTLGQGTSFIFKLKLGRVINEKG